MFAKLRRARLLAVAGCLTAVTAADAADATPPAVPIVGAPVYAAPAVGCDTCSAPCGPTLGGVTGLGAAGTGIGLFAPNPPWWHKRQRIDGQNQPACAVNSYPLSDWAYIRKFCGPTLIPGTCYGHFQTKWRKWEDHCPQGAVGCTPGAVVGAEVPFVQSAPVLAAPVPMPAAPKVDAPKSDGPKAVPVVPKTDEPMKPKTGDENGQLLPIPLPDAPAPLPALPVLPPQEARR